MILNLSSAQVQFLAQLVHYPITHFNYGCSSTHQWQWITTCWQNLKWNVHIVLYMMHISGHPDLTVWYCDW